MRAAYRRLARQFHPDVNRSAGASERMRELNAAYAVLCDGPTPAVPVPAASASTTYTRHPAPSSVVGAPRWAGAAGAVSSVAFPTLFQSNAITIGIVAGFFGLVALFGVWAIAVARPFGGTVTSPARATQAPTIQSTTGSLAAQASANAAANAAAARSNLTGGAVVPTTSIPAPISASTAGASSSSPSSASAVATSISAAGTSVQAAAAPNVPDAPEPPAVPASPVMAAAPSSPSRSAMPSLPAVPAAQSNPNQTIQAVSAQSAQSAATSDQTTLTQTATRALSNYDKAWTGYASALRFAAAGSLLTSPANSSPLRATTGAPVTAVSFLSPDSQLTMARSFYLQQQLAWNPQASAALTAAAITNAIVSQPDAAKTVRADQRLRQAADLVSQAQSSGAPINAGQVKSLLDEAEQLHRESVAEWAKLLSALVG